MFVTETNTSPNARAPTRSSFSALRGFAAILPNRKDALEVTTSYVVVIRIVPINARLKIWGGTTVVAITMAFIRDGPTGWLTRKSSFALKMGSTPFSDH
jgi:hypothetical protein